MSTSLHLAVTLAASAGFVFFTLAAMKLETFNKAKLRKLKELSKTLAERLEYDYPLLLRLRLAAHFLSLLSCTATLCCLFWQLAREPAVQSYIWCGIWVLLIFAALEILNEVLSLTITARLLVWNFLLYRMVFWVLAPVLFPLSCWIEKIRAKSASYDELYKVTAEDEILSLVEDDEEIEANSPNHQGLERDERRMLNGVMNLDKTFVHEVMTPRVDLVAVDESANLQDLKQAIAASGHSRIPIYHDTIDTISGIVYAKDLISDEKLRQSRIALDIARKPVFIPESKNVGDLLEEFRLTRNHLAIVLDEYGGTAGVVTIEDILEEIVGEIQDEFDVDEGVNPDGHGLEPDGSIVNDGRITIWEVNQLLDLDISEEQGYDTLGGYIMAFLGRIPQSGEHIVTDDLEIDILEADPRKLLLVRARRRQVPSEDHAEL
ncbi:MAG: HlyC/CorC family transporter [Oligosphaeraceae bacterium]|nr:HlyC/CorC family transporter [Oligosphaeraceae bacterium]